LTRFLAGDERPKQFCSIFGGQTLVEQTLRGVSQVVPVSRTVIVLTRAHERFYGPLPPGNARQTMAGVLGSPLEIFAASVNQMLPRESA
jgi:mannose-1-phosphate guanylyltransferase